jgi:hypothetical protein
VTALATLGTPLPAQAPLVAPEALHAPLDQILDIYVRDGFVYYRALASERARLDRYVASLDVPSATVAGWDRHRQAAFWINAYNALVMRTVIDHYPIRGRAGTYPANSIRQIPGAFDRTIWRVAGIAVTLDDIEKSRVASFDDPRMFFALGRGAVGSGRLRSEAYTAARLDAQLADVRRDCLRRVTCVQVDEQAGAVLASAVFGWREPQFVAAFASALEGRYPGRTPIELAVLAYVDPNLYPSEREWLARNTFAVRYVDFDWRLNDLTGGAPR